MTVLLLTFGLLRSILLIDVEGYVRFDLASVGVEHGRLGCMCKTRVVALLSWEISGARRRLDIVTRVNHHVIAGFWGQTPVLIKLNAIWSILRLTIEIEVRVGHHSGFTSIEFILGWSSCASSPILTRFLVSILWRSRSLQHLKQTTFLNSYLFTEWFEDSFKLQDLFDWTSCHFLWRVVILGFPGLTALSLRSLWLLGRRFWCHHCHQTLNQVSFTLSLNYFGPLTILMTLN
jgi:hypothetical protein